MLDRHRAGPAHHLRRHPGPIAAGPGLHGRDRAVELVAIDRPHRATGGNGSDGLYGSVAIEMTASSVTDDAELEGATS